MLTNRRRLKEAMKVARAKREFFSIKVLKKEMRLGYYPAAKLLNEMECSGYIGPYKSGKRDVYI